MPPNPTDQAASAPAMGAALIEAILSRRSVPPRHLQAPGPSASQLARMVEAATSAPDHRGLRPFRFIDIANRSALAEAFVAAEREQNPAATQEDVDRARERAHHAPSLVAVVTRTDAHNPEVTVAEQVASAGGALTLLLLAAHAMGYGAMAVSGDKAHSQTLRRALHLADHESLLCFVGIGTPGKTRGPRKPPETPLLTRWEG